MGMKKKESTWPEECNHVNGNPRTGRDSEWRDLDIDNLPNDISKGCDIYDFQIFYPIPGWVESVSGIAAILRMAESGDHMFRYRERKPEQKQPSHEEIMTLWWAFGILRSSGSWQKVESYSPCNEDGEASYYIGGEWMNVSFFTGRESATIPPEAK